MLKPINISLAPNYQLDDVILALRVLLRPWKWFDKKIVMELEDKFSKLFGNSFRAFAVNSGRSGEFLILKSLSIGKGDEVIVQAFTCVAVPNPIIWAGARVVYADVDDHFNINPISLEKLITKRTKAIIVQHTFGIPAQIKLIKDIARKHNLFLIEDCCHSLGATFENNYLGTFGDVAFFSFGRDKVISSVFGGMIITKNPEISKKIESQLDKLPNPTIKWVIQQLFHPILTFLLLRFSNIIIGKFLLLVTQKLSILSRSVYKEEKLTGRPSVFPAKMPGALAFLAINQLAKLKSYNLSRNKMAKFYFDKLAEFESQDFILPPKDSGAIWLRFPILTNKAQEIIEFARLRGIVLGDWYSSLIAPADNLDIFGYLKGSCKKAEEFASKIINLPTGPNLTVNDGKKIVAVISNFYEFEGKRN